MRKKLTRLASKALGRNEPVMRVVTVISTGNEIFKVKLHGTGLYVRPNKTDIDDTPNWSAD